MVYGVAFNNPDATIIKYLEKLQYKRESEYICMHVTNPDWEGGKRVAKDIRLGYMTTDEMWERLNELRSLVSNSFQGTLPMPDSSGPYRLEEIIKTYEEIPKSHFKVKGDIETHSKIEEYKEAWKNCDVEKVVLGAPMAFDRKTGKLVGAILAIANIFEDWQGKPITRMNVDTAMVDKNHAGKGIFSALNNIGQVGVGLNGITYIEGTTIWNNNPDAIKAIFPHGKTVRAHYMMQKRIKSNTRRV